MGRYYIDPDFVPPEPTPADFFHAVADPGTPELRRRVIVETFDRWREQGVGLGRVTLTGPDVEGDDSGYPSGLWLEGWKNSHARCWPFGKGYPDENGPAYPPLTCDSDRLPKGEDSRSEAECEASQSGGSEASASPKSPQQNPQSKDPQ